MAAITRPHTIVPTRTPRRGATGAGPGSWVVMAVASAGVAGTVGGAPAVVGVVMVSSEWFMGRVSVSPAETTAITTHDPGPAPVAPRRGVRVGTIVWGLVIAAIGAGILAYALDVTFDAQLASIIVIFAAGALLLIGSIATSRRRRG